MQQSLPTGPPNNGVVPAFSQVVLELSLQPPAYLHGQRGLAEPTEPHDGEHGLEVVLLAGPSLESRSLCLVLVRDADDSLAVGVVGRFRLTSLLLGLPVGRPGLGADCYSDCASLTSDWFWIRQQGFTLPDDIQSLQYSWNQETRLLVRFQDEIVTFGQMALYAAVRIQIFAMMLLLLISIVLQGHFGLHVNVRNKSGYPAQ